MLTYPNIDPIALQLGPIAIRWYGLMYLVGFFGGYWLALQRSKSDQNNWTKEQCQDLLFYTAMGVILGARIGYILFYDFGGIISDPLRILRVWEGGMSFHGGLLGVLTSWVLLKRKQGKAFFEIADFTAPFVPIGLGAGRLGNFINGELWGKVTDAPWAMVPYPGAFPRHPTQLYEFFLEGVCLFTILWLYSAKKRPTMAVSGMFLLCYGVFRFAVEFVRVPDAHLGYLALGWVTMGQILTAPMIIIGLTLLLYAYRKKPLSVSTEKE